MSAADPMLRRLALAALLLAALPAEAGTSEAHEKTLSPYFVVDIIINMAPGLLSIKTGARGPNFSHVSACSSGAHSIGEAMRTIRHGYADVMLAGGAEATITVLGVGGFTASRALSTQRPSPFSFSKSREKVSSFRRPWHTR